MSRPDPTRAFAVSAVLLFLATPSIVEAAYTSTVVGTTATMIGSAAGDTLIITQSGGLFHHNRVGDPGFFGSDIDFDSSAPGIQTVPSTTGVININAGDGDDTIVFGDGVDLRGTVDGGPGTDTLDYSAYPTAIGANLGLGTSGLNATLGAEQEVPVTTSAATGTVAVSNYSITAHTFDISVTLTGLLPANVTGFHIHRAVVGANGPIVIDLLPLGAFFPAGPNFTFNATGVSLPALNEAAFLGGATYVDIHTAASPGGAIRGQLFSSGSLNLASGTATATTSVANVENVTGGTNDDSLVGNFFVNTIIGASGADWIVGGPADDTLLGSAGADVLMWNHGDGTDLDEGGTESDTVQVNGSTNIITGDVFTVSPSGPRILFTRTSITTFTLDIGTTETVIVNGLGGDDSVTVNDLTGVSSLALNLNGFDGNDVFTFVPAAAGVFAFNVNGGPGTDTLQGPNGASTWNVTAANQGNITGLVNFGFIEALSGGAGNDTFNVKAFVTGTATVVTGGPGADALLYDAESRTVSGDATPPDGVIDSTGVQSVTFTQIETVNTSPSVGTIANQTTNEDTPLSLLPFTVSDLQTPVASLTVAGSSSNPTLMPTANIVFGGTGSSRNVTLTPAANQSGTATITVTVSDGSLSGAASFQLTVNAVNDAPTISAITSQTTNHDTPTSPIVFTVSDAETPAASLTVSGSSSNPTLVPTQNIVFGGSGADRTVTITPAANRSGVATIGVTVSDGSLSSTTAFVLIVTAPPAMSLDKSSLIFGAVTTGAAFSSKTGTQTVRLTQTGTGAVSWTAISTTPWLVVSPTSGSGSATLNLSVQFAPGLASTQSGNVTLTFAGATSGALPIAVTLNTVTSAAAPQGSFDTPTDNISGVAGSIAVTGWALDDIEVTRVRILRSPLSAEPALQLVFIGDAVMVDGARPDVQAMFPTLPRASRAGWGYLLLTNFLPSLGNGTFRLWAIADDADGQSTILGSKVITCSNSTATAPFGAIDTPAQDGIVSANVTNFGWVLSPGPRRADPPAGGMVQVVVDGAFLSIVPTGWTSRADLSALFAAALYPGIVNALGVANFDSTVLANGVHTISWVVTDNLGSASGIGSRYFRVSNGGLFGDPSSFRLKAETTGVEGTGVGAAGAAAAPRNSEVPWLPPSGGSLRARRGFDPNAAYRTYTPDHDGRIIVASEELDRIELQLGDAAGQRYAGYLRVGDGLAPLPIGSSLDSSTGAFTWMPGVGFVGTYDLVFVRLSGGRAVARQDVRIVLNPMKSNRVGPQTVIDIPAVASAEVRRSFVLAGWAADLDSTVDRGVDTVHVWAYPLGGSDPIWVGEATYGGARPDVAAVYGDRFLKTGYGLSVQNLSPGIYDLAVFAYSTVRGGFVPAKTVRVTVK